MEIRSATRKGWSTLGGMCMIPCLSRMSFVRWLAAARKISGAEEWEYSSRKRCSASHTQWTPTRSGEFHEVQRVLEDLPLLVFAPRLGNGVFQEQRDFHRLPLSGRPHLDGSDGGSLAHRVSWMKISRGEIVWPADMFDPGEALT